MWQFHPLLVVFSMGGLVAVGVGVYCWRYVQRYGASYLVGGMGMIALANAVWVFAATFKTVSASVGASLFFYKLEYLGSGVGPAIWVVVALAFVGKDRWITRRVIGVLGGVSGAFVLLLVVNPADAMITDPVLVRAQGIMAFEHSIPPLHVVFLAWLFGLATVAVLILAVGVVTDRVPTRLGIVAMLTVGIPLVTAVLKTAGVYPPGGKGINVTPAATSIGIGIFAFALVRYRLFDLIPVGRDRAMEVMADGYLLVGENGTVLDANPAAKQLLTGLDGAPLEGRSASDVFDEYERLDERDVVQFTSDGRTIEIRSSEVTRQNQAAGRVLLLQDITERKERERRYQEQNERLSALFENTQSAVVEYVLEDGEPVVEDVNGRFETVFGFDTETVAGRSADEFIVPPDYHTEAENLNERVRRGEYLSAEVDRQTVDGVRTFMLRNAPIDTADDDEVRGYAIYTDITERKEREKALEETNRELEQSNEKLDQFAGMVSHDLRNPLMVIQGRAQLLRGEVPDEHVDPIERNADRMETMIEDLLTLSRGGESVDDPEPVALADIVADSWTAVSSDDIELAVDVPDDLEVEADGDRLRHVFENLFRNAREHNDPPVTIRVGTIAGETGVVSGFFIADDGDGIPEAEREEVFEHGFTTDTDGTGFGLSIVEEIVDAHGWAISVGESDAGGARFDVHTTGQN